MISNVILAPSVKPLYKYVRSNNNNAKYIHIVKDIKSVNGNWVSVKTLCGAQIGTQRKLTFLTDNKSSPCIKCAIGQISNLEPDLNKWKQVNFQTFNRALNFVRFFTTIGYMDFTQYSSVEYKGTTFALRSASEKYYLTPPLANQVR
ncbi:MAG: hypothetical protein COA78_12055 [Blastopirellula sp.]|nr:MAG: hypothetical protein COA78_12055 [Blastopirellula sp.]